MKFTDRFKQVGRERGVEASAEDVKYTAAGVPELAAWDIPRELARKVKERVHKEIGEAEKLPTGKAELDSASRVDRMP